ncbi:NAD(P)H-binding protein [Rhodovibrionaceae bacterium A322]
MTDGAGSMLSTARVAVVAGASGAVGSALVPLLQAHPESYRQIILLSRRETGLGQLPKVREIAVNFQSLDDLKTALHGVVSSADWDLFCAVGTTRKKAGSLSAFRAVDLDIPLKLGQLAKEAGARACVVVSSIGASATSSSSYLKCKGDMEEGLLALTLSSLSLLRPALLVAQRPESRPGETFAHWVLLAVTPLLCGPLRKYRPIRVEQVAAAMLKLAHDSKKGSQIIESDCLCSLAGSLRDGAGAD